MTKNRILFLNGSYPFCYYYRGYLPGVYGDQLVVMDFLRKDMKVDQDKLAQMREVSDIIVFQRPSTKEHVQLAELLKAKGKKIIFDNDDTYKGIPLERLDNQKQIDIAKEQEKNIDDFLKLSDGVVASTQTLAEEYGKINPNVVVCKNCIDPLDEFECLPNTTGRCRIGFIGSVTSNDDYVHIKETIKKLDETDEYTLVVMGVKYSDGKVVPSMQEDADFWSSLKNVEWHPYVHITEYMQQLARLALDMAIIPRKEHYFNECKSNLKFLEMSLLKIPVIAQGFTNGKSPYQGKDEEYMTVVIHNDTWFDVINDVKCNYAKYKSLALKAHDYVLRDYNIETYAPEWIKNIKQLIK